MAVLKKKHDLSKIPTQRSLIGEDIFLRPVTADDIANAHVWTVASDPQSMTCRPFPYKTAAEAAEIFKKKHDPNSLERQAFAIVRIEDKRPVGLIRYFSYNTANRSAELGFIVDPDERRQGMASDAVRTIVKHLFEQLGLNKVYAQTGSFNKASCSMLEKLGFKRDGVLRDHHFYNGEFHADYVYSLLRYELDW